MIASKLGVPSTAESAPAILREIAGSVEALAGLTWTALGAQGKPVAGAVEGAAPKRLPLGTAAGKERAHA
jgi:hypothetical protein